MSKFIKRKVIMPETPDHVPACVAPPPPPRKQYWCLDNNEVDFWDCDCLFHKNVNDTKRN